MCVCVCVCVQGPHWYDECAWPLKGACTAPPKGDFEGYIDLYQNAAAAIETNTLVREGRKAHVSRTRPLVGHIRTVPLLSRWTIQQFAGMPLTRVL